MNTKKEVPLSNVARINLAARQLGYDESGFECKEVSWADWMIVREQTMLDAEKQKVDIELPL